MSKVATNGLITINVGGEKYPLRFGRASVEEMSKRVIENTTANNVKMFADLIYSGMMNEAIFKDIPFPAWGDVYEIVELFQEEEDSAEQYEAIWQCFQQSRWGSKWFDELNNIKKKVDLEIKKMSKTKK